MFDMPKSMKRSKTVLALFIAFVLVTPLFGQIPWPPISPEEMALKDCPEQPGASAICLYYEKITDHEQFTTKVFKRLKILTAAGREQANIEIFFYKGTQLVTDIEARVVPPDGRSLTFRGQIFEKTAIRTRAIRVAVKTFALPDVQPGCIIDYRYKIVPDSDGSSSKDDELLAELQLSKGKPEEGGYPKSFEILSFPAVHWDLQGDLFIRKARFEYISCPYIWVLFQRSCRLAWVAHAPANYEPEIKGSRVNFEIQNVPAFVEEEFMTPEESERMSVDVFYLDLRVRDYKEYWERECKTWQKSAQKFIGNPGKLVPEVQTLVGDEESPVERLKKIYERAQSIRNLSYEKGLTRKQRKEQKIKVNKTAADVLERNYGLRSDITRTFVALARAAGFDANVARVSTRDDKLFRIMLLTFYDQLDSELAEVQLGEKTMLFDPATPFCPFGLVHWSRSRAAAVRFSDKPPAFFTTPDYPPLLALTQREVVLRLNSQSHLTGTIKTTYTGHEALVRRLEHIHNDREDIRKSLEEELAGILPLGASVMMKNLDNIDNNNPALVVEYDVTIPGLVTLAGDHMLLPASPLLGAKQYPFRHAQRRYPVYFPYSFREFNDIVIVIPEGLTVETRPEPKKTQSDFSSYSLVCVQEGPQKLHIQRDLVIQKNYFPVEQYAAIKAFYDMVRTHDEEQFVLGKGKK